jgi:hypothetical protein
MPSTSAVLQGLLRISPGEAKARVTAARACGPRTSPTGQALPPVLPDLAATQAQGSISGEHTAVILTALNRPPAAVGYEDRRLAEKHLVQAATTLRLREVGVLGRRIRSPPRATGAVLNHGRTRRIATRSQTLALIARDKGCSFLGCDQPSETLPTPPHHRLGRRRHHRPEQPR